MKPRINDLITVFLIQLVLTLPFYSSNVYGLTISNVRVTKAAANSATIEWNTDNTSSGKVRYGQTTGLGFTQRHDNFLLNHTITVINGISSNTLYFFSVESTDINGNTTVDNNSNNFYTFRTLDITPPQQVAGLKVLSTTFDSVSLSWNAVNASDLSHYVIYRDRIPAANSTSNSFIDTGLSSNTEFIYKVSAVDTSDNEGPLSDTVIASTLRFDTTPPIISSVEALPLTDATARITWLTDENSTTTAFYGINKTDNTRSIDGFAINHSIVVDKLIKNNVYIFTVRSCDSSDNCANSSGNFTSGKDATIPFLNLSIPKCVNRRTADIIGTTEPFSKVTLFVNDFNVPKRSLGSSEVGSSGKFVFSQVQLQDSNTIKIAIEDRSGNKNQKTFDVKVDTQDPAVQLSEVPSLVSKLNLSFSGSADEPVTIRVFADADANKSSVPSKINGLNATKIRQNSVELGWNESKDKDFSHYAVYRSDIGAIAVTKPSNFNLYIDALVDSGKSYTYYVSAVNIFGAEGEKSERITVTTSKGGEVLNLKPAAVDIFEDFRKPLLVVNTTGKFNFGVKLDKGDGDYTIKAIFEDCAENSVTIQKDVTLDTKKPEVKITSPSSGAFIFENVANEIDVIGKTKPNARVHLFVDRTPFSFYNQSFELSGLPNEVQDLDEAKLDAKCRSSVSVSFCRTGADFSVDADEQGNFKFENVDLTTIFGGASRIREVPVTDFRDTQLNQEAQESKKTTLVVIATDKVGQRGVATQTVRIGTCWSGNQSWDIIPLTQYQSPTFLSTERFAEGTETAYFYFNYSYIGRGQSAKITDISLSKACGTREVLDPRFNISCQIMPSGNSPVKLNKPDNTLSYSAVPLSRFLGMDRFLEDDWKSFFKSINNELTLPFKVRITYEHDVTNENGQSVRVKETQTTCEQVSYVVDNSIIDPRKVLPDWLLFDAVDFLQTSIKTISQIQEQISKLIDYVAIGCLYSIIARTFVKIWRIWTEFSDEKIFAKIQDYTSLSFNLGSEDKNQDCKEIMGAIKQGYGNFKIKYLSDAELQKCFPSSASAWKTEANLYQAQRWTCDRIFGHSAPSAWTETEDDTELYRKVTSEKTCESDFDTQGQRLKAEECKSLPSRYIDVLKDPKDIPVGKKCFLLSNPDNQKEQFIYTLANDQDPVLNSNKIYKLESYERRYRDAIYAVKLTEDVYMTNFPKTCAELCS
ncbi:fibronectin type III domain-containing protein, partial [Candidatus Woesearchaeota archaeon]|nr:fibronectin type III domain-containing protein [Candidatus Woesearchaeota archaeon]